jgi:formate dehydrogenase iron-sulfur subunit
MMSILDQKLSRRRFLKTMGVSAAAATAGLLMPGCGTTALASEPASADAIGMLVDLTRCTGCQNCTLACKSANGLARPNITPWQLDSGAYTFLDQRSVTAGDGAALTQFVKRQCMHCLHPACVSACTVGAMTKSATGPVVYDDSKCFGCRYCQYACPFAVPTYEWKNPLGLIHKCEFCHALLDQGKTPACAASCPTGALRFGKRENLLGQARAQIASNPGHYVNQIYGEHEVGGTSFLYLSQVPFADLGLPTLGSDTVSRYAESVMNMTPFTAVTVAAIATGGYLWSGRRQREHELSPVTVEAKYTGERR